MRAGVHSWQAIDRAPVKLRDRVLKSRTPNLPNGTRRQGRQRRPVLTFSSSSSKNNEKSSTSQSSLDTLDLLLNSADPSPGMLSYCVQCKTVRMVCQSSHV